MELSGPRWKGKNFAQIANSNPMSEIIAQLQVCLSNSESAALPIGTDFLLETEPELTNLLNRTSFGRQLITPNGSKQYFQLSPEETFYLHHSLKCLKVSINNGNLIDVNDLWNFMRSRNELFPIYYRAYMHLRSKNWVVKSGMKNGVDYVVYRHHPALVHSEYAVIVDWEKERGDKEGERLRVWSDLHCAIRACNGVAKAVLLLDIMGDEVKFSLPELLETMTVDERQITRWLPSQCRDDCKLEGNKDITPLNLTGSNESLFTCELHHGGTVCMEDSKFGYNGGQKDYFDYVTMAEELGYSKEISVWCRVCGEKEKRDPKLMISDQDLMVMVDKIPKGNRMFEFFLEHKSSELEIENGASNFYDPANDVEADDIDVASDKNVINDTTRYWVVPLQTETEPEIGEEDSDYAPSDVLISGDESDEDTSQRYPEFNAVVDITNPQFQVGMIFGYFEFKNAIKEYAIKQRRNIHFEKNDTLRVKASCKKGCSWKIRVSYMGNGTENVQVKTYNSSHACSNEHNTKFLMAKWLVNKYLGTFRADPTWSLSGIQARVRADLHLEISRQKANTVRSTALKIIAGNEEEQYLKLQCYAAEIRRTNPGSTIIYHLRNEVFKRAYVCMAACKEGFLAGCMLG